MLSDTEFKHLKRRAKPYKVSDRDGMYAYVSTTGTVSFRYDYRINRRGNSALASFLQMQDQFGQGRRFLSTARIVDVVAGPIHIAVTNSAAHSVPVSWQTSCWCAVNAELAVALCCEAHRLRQHRANHRV